MILSESVVMRQDGCLNFITKHEFPQQMVTIQEKTLF